MLQQCIRTKTGRVGSDGDGPLKALIDLFHLQTGREIRVNSGTIAFRVKANSAGIYFKDGPGKIDEDGAYLR